MGIYLGQLGRMVELKCPATQQVSTADGFTFEETLEGRVKAQARPFQRRTWSLGTSDATTPAQQATLLGFVAGEWGPGPFVFVSADAPVTNMLSPAAANCLETLTSANVIAGGPVNLGSEGWAGSSWSTVNPAVGGIYYGTSYVPVAPGRRVTGAAYVMGAGASVQLYWYDSSNTFISASVSAPEGVAGTMKRISVSGLPPAGAASCRLVSVSASQGARPAITWTSEVFPWAAGEGCPKAVVHGASKSLVLASRDLRGGRYANLSYTVTEVG